MNKNVLKSISNGSNVHEDIIVNGRRVPLVLTGENGIYICVDDATSVEEDEALYESIKERFGLKPFQLFLYKFQDGCRGYSHGSGQCDDIYEAFRTCYEFTSSYYKDAYTKKLAGLFEQAVA